MSSVCYQFTVEGTDDSADWNEVLEAMETMMMSPEEKFDIISVTAAVLHLGNIEFGESGVEVAVPADRDGKVSSFLCLNCLIIILITWSTTCNNSIYILMI